MLKKSTWDRLFKIHPKSSQRKHEVTSLKLTASLPLKIDGWKVIHFLLGFGLFSEDMLVSGRVTSSNLTYQWKIDPD